MLANKRTNTCVCLNASLRPGLQVDPITCEIWGVMQIELSVKTWEEYGTNRKDRSLCSGQKTLLYKTPRINEIDLNISNWYVTFTWLEVHSHATGGLAFIYPRLLTKVSTESERCSAVIGFLLRVQEEPVRILAGRTAWFSLVSSLSPSRQREREYCKVGYKVPFTSFSSRPFHPYIIPIC
jgi:hypothetical protein